MCPVRSVTCPGSLKIHGFCLPQWTSCPEQSHAAQGLEIFKNVFNFEQTRQKQNGYFCCIHPQWWPLHLPHEALGHATWDLGVRE
jgi:hypothetical protein